MLVLRVLYVTVIFPVLLATLPTRPRQKIQGAPYDCQDYRYRDERDAHGNGDRRSQRTDGDPGTQPERRNCLSSNGDVWPEMTMEAPLGHCDRCPDERWDTNTHHEDYDPNHIILLHQSVTTRKEKCQARAGRHDFFFKAQRVSVPPLMISIPVLYVAMIIILVYLCWQESQETGRGTFSEKVPATLPAGE